MLGGLRITASLVGLHWLSLMLRNSAAAVPITNTSLTIASPLDADAERICLDDGKQCDDSKKCCVCGLILLIASSWCLSDNRPFLVFLHPSSE